MDHHVVSYYRDEDVRSERLQRPNALHEVMALTIPPELIKSSKFRHPPRIGRWGDHTHV